MRRTVHPGRTAKTKMPVAGNLHVLIDVEKDVHQGIRLRNIDKRLVRQHSLHHFLEVFPFIISVEVIDHQEPAARQILSQTLRVLRGGIPSAGRRLLKP